MNLLKILGTKRKKRILITGAAGFIGSHLYELLKKEGNIVVGIDNFSHPCGKVNSEIKWADVRYYHDIEKYVANADIVYHLAAQIHVDKSIDHVEETLDTNIMGTYNVLEACRKLNRKLIFASTSEIYGQHHLKISENFPTYPQSPYAVSKLAGDKLCGNYHKLYGTRLIRLRNFNTFGPWQNEGQYGAVIPIFVRQALKGQEITIYGDGKQERDFMYIEDCLEGYKIVTGLDTLEGEPINVGSGRAVSINELAQTICKIVGVPFRPRYLPPRPGEVRKLQADTTLIEKFGYKSKVGLEKGLEKYIEWYKENKLI